MTSDQAPDRGLPVIARFGVVGVAATLVHAVVLGILISGVGMWSPLANLTAFLVAFGVSYFGHRRFTFDSRRPHIASLPIFALVAGTGAAANFAVFVLFADLLRVPWGWTFLISLATVSPLIFVLSRNLAFNDDAPALRADWKRWGPAAGLFAAAAAMTLLLYHPLPMYDHWDLVPLYDRALNGQLTFADLFRPHGGHWHATGYMVMLTLARLTGMSHLAEVTASLGIALIGGVVLLRLCAERAAAFQAKSVEAWLIALLAFFWFSLDQAPNWLWGWQVAVFLNTTGAMIAVAALSGDRLNPLAASIAAAAAAIAIYAFATGLALLPIGLALIAVHRDKRGRVLAALLWTAFSLAILLHYRAAVLQPASDYVAGVTPKSLNLQALIDLALFTLTFVGGSVGRFSDGLAIPAALIGAGGALWSLRILRRAEPLWLPLAAPFLALALYGLGSGLLTGYGRLGFGVEQGLVSRYISFGNFYWMGVLGMMVLALGHAGGKMARRVIIGLIALFLVFKLANIANVVIDKNVVEDHQKMAQAAARIVETYPAPAPAAMLTVSTAEQAIQPRIEVLARRELSLFRRPPADSGQ